MDPAAQAKWPDVPACYGWLSLDRRGQWRLQGEPVRHSGLIAFLNRNYGCDAQGNWFVQNGPQKVYAALEYTPWVVRRDGERLVTHTGREATALSGAWIDEEGSLLLLTDLGPALVDDRDLADLLEQVQDGRGCAASEDDLLRVMTGGSVDLHFLWQARKVPLAFLARADAPCRFAYVTEPAP